MEDLNPIQEQEKQNIEDIKSNGEMPKKRKKFVLRIALDFLLQMQ